MPGSQHVAELLTGRLTWGFFRVCRETPAATKLVPEMPVSQMVEQMAAPEPEPDPAPEPPEPEPDAAIDAAIDAARLAAHSEVEAKREALLAEGVMDEAVCLLCPRPAMVPTAAASSRG